MSQMNKWQSNHHVMTELTGNVRNCLLVSVTVKRIPFSDVYNATNEGDGDLTKQRVFLPGQKIHVQITDAYIPDNSRAFNPYVWVLGFHNWFFMYWNLLLERDLQVSLVNFQKVCYADQIYSGITNGRVLNRSNCNLFLWVLRNSYETYINVEKLTSEFLCS